MGTPPASFFSPFSQIIELTTVDGSDLELGEPIGRTVYGSAPYRTSELWGFFFGIGGPITQIDAGHRPPVEAVDSARIATASAGYLDYGNDEFGVFATIDRTFLEYLLKQSIWIAAFGLVVGVLVWLALSRGLAGPSGRDLAILVGAAAAVPFVLLPVVQVGTDRRDLRRLRRAVGGGAHPRPDVRTLRSGSGIAPDRRGRRPRGDGARRPPRRPLHDLSGAVSR